MGTLSFYLFQCMHLDIISFIREEFQIGFESFYIKEWPTWRGLIYILKALAKWGKKAVYKNNYHTIHCFFLLDIIIATFPHSLPLAHPSWAWECDFGATFADFIYSNLWVWVYGTFNWLGPKNVQSFFFLSVNVF